MARVTVEDCLEHVDNRFELVMLQAVEHEACAATAPKPWCRKKMTSLR